MKKLQSKKLTQEEVINWWLTKYHNTNLAEIKEKHPEIDDSRKFYSTFKVTQEQHDEWYEWVIGRVMKENRISKTLAIRRYCWDYLNTSPSVINEGNK